MTTEAGKRLHNRIFGLSDVMPGGAELDSLIAAVEAEARATAGAENERLRAALTDLMSAHNDECLLCARKDIIARAALAPKEPTRG